MPEFGHYSQNILFRGYFLAVDNDLILVDFDNAGAIISKHLMINFIDYCFILKAGQIIYFPDLEGVYKISGFVNQSDLNVVG